MKLKIVANEETIARVKIDSYCTVYQLKQKIARRTKIPVANQRLISERGHALVDKKKALRDYHLWDGSILTLVLIAPIRCHRLEREEYVEE